MLLFAAAVFCGTAAAVEVAELAEDMPADDGTSYVIGPSNLIHIKIYGPADANGKRLVWLNKVLRELVASKFQRQTPPSLPSLTGMALSKMMGQVLEAAYAADGRDARPERAAATQPLKNTTNAKNTNKN